MTIQDTIKCSYKKLASFNHYQNNEFTKNGYLYKIILSNAKCCYNAIQNMPGYILAIVYNHSNENNKIILDFTAGISETVERNEKIPETFKRGLAEEVGIIINGDLFDQYHKNRKIKICRQTFNEQNKRSIYMSHSIAINIDNLTDDKNSRPYFDPCMSSYISCQEMKEHKNNVYKTCLFVFSKSRERIEQKLSEINSRLLDNDNIFGVACISCNYMKYLYNTKFNNKTNIILSDDDKIIDLYQRFDIIETKENIASNKENIEKNEEPKIGIMKQNSEIIEQKLEIIEPNIKIMEQNLEITNLEIININLDIIKFLESLEFDNFNNDITNLTNYEIRDSVNNCIDILNNNFNKLTRNQRKNRRKQKRNHNILLTRPTSLTPVII